MILRVIVPTLQIVETSLGIIVISTISERVDLGQIALRRDYLAPRGIDIFCLHDAICVNDLNNIALQIEDVIIGARNTPVDRIVKCKRSAGFVIEEVQRFVLKTVPLTSCRIVSLATFPFCVRYSCVTVSVEASVQSDSDKPGSAATGSSAGAAFGFGSIGSHGSSSREIKVSGKINFVRRKRALPFCRLCGTC